jgi:DNA repair ATPase RecN
MKKTNYLFVLTLGIGLVSCNSELKEDAERLAEFQCEIKAMSKNTEIDEDSMNEAKELGEEMIEFQEKIAEKYKDPQDLVEFEKIFKEKLNETCYE